MKFITEEDLRNLFRKEPFTTYELKEGERLTPGAREFLTDHGINRDNRSNMIEKTSSNNFNKNNLKKKLFQCKAKSIEVLFLESVQELLSIDVLLAKSVITLYKQFSTIKNITKEESLIDEFYFKECSGIKEDNFNEDIDDCFEITDFHINLEKGREIIILHKLRCILRELELYILELFENDDSKSYQYIIEKLNKIINTLSQIICSILGGKTCQRRS